MDDATASWNGRSLSVFGKSDECGIYFCGIPFGPANQLAEIKGRQYAGEGDTPFSEGHAMIGGQSLHMMSGTINCIGVSPAGDAVVIEFSVEAEDERGRTRQLSGGIRCRIVPQIDPAADDLGL